MCTTLFDMNYKYLTPEMLKGFDNYKYSAIDSSPISRYLMHPFWNNVVLLCPRWMAPNLLTFLGFLLTLSAALLLSYYDWDFYGDSIPSWVFLVVPALIFVGYTLDGIDGKQARNTGTSSPLGELFDHGLDSWTAALIPVCLYSVFGRGDYSVPPYRYYFVVWNVFLTFYITHWEKYITGTLFLPWGYDLSMLVSRILHFGMYLCDVVPPKFIMQYILSSPTFGLGTIASDTASTVAVFIFMYFTDQSLWAYKVTENIHLGHMVETIFYLTSIVPTLPVCVLNIRKSYIEKTGKNLALKEAIRPLAPLATFAFVTILWSRVSPNNIVTAHPRAFYFLTGNVFSNITCRLVVSQMSGTRCRTTNALILPVLAGLILSYYLPFMEITLVYLLLALTTWAHLHYGICVVDQMCDHLQIRCFKIDPKPKSK